MIFLTSLRKVGLFVKKIRNNGVEKLAFIGMFAGNTALILMESSRKIGNNPYH